MTLEEMRRRVRRHLGERSDIEEDDIDEGLNAHLLMLADAFEFEEQETQLVMTTEAGVDSFERPEQFRVVDQIRMLDPWMQDSMTKLSYAKFSNLYPVPGWPDRFSEFGGKIWMHPTPDNAVEIKLIGRGVLGELKDPQDEPPIPLPWHKVLVLYTSSELAFEHAMDDRGMSLKNQALGRISTLTEHRTLRRRTEQDGLSISRRKP